MWTTTFSSGETIVAGHVRTATNNTMISYIWLFIIGGPHVSNLGCTYIVQRIFIILWCFFFSLKSIYCSVIFPPFFSFLLCSNWTGTYFVHSSLYFSCSHWKRWHRNNFIHSISIWFDLIFAFMFTTWRTDLRAEKIVRRVFWTCHKCKI